MKKTFTLLALAMMAICSYATTSIWKADANTATSANYTYVDDNGATVKTVYGTTLKDDNRNIGGESFTHYVQVRVNAYPTSDNLTGTEQSGSTPLVYSAKEDQTLTVYYRRQCDDNNNPGTFTSGGGKDLKVFDQVAPTTALSGTMTIESQSEDGKYGYGYQVFELTKGHIYTICAKGTTIQFYGFKYEYEVDLTTVVTLRGTPNFTPPIGDGNSTIYWNIAVRNANNNILPVNSTDDMEYFFRDTSIAAFDHVTTSGNSGFNLVMKILGVGTCDVTVKFKGGTYDGVTYSPSEETYTLTVTNNMLTLSFAEIEQTISYGASAPTNALTCNISDATITYSSSNESIATVASDGTVTVNNSGDVTITALATADNYDDATASYMLHVTPTDNTAYDVAWSKPGDYSMPLGYNYDNTAVPSGDYSGIDWAFKSSDENVAYIEVNDLTAHVVGTGNGTCTITVYPTNNGAKAYHEASFTLTVTAGNVDMYFMPEEGYVNVGHDVTPYINFGGAMLDKVISITAESNDPSIATVPEDIIATNNYEQTEEGGKPKVANIYVPITGVSEGTTTITVYFKSYQYADATATYTIHVTPSGTRNFKWDDDSDIYVFKGDMVALPGIVGNSNGNYDYSVGANNKYYYSIKRNNGGFNPTYNNRDWHKGEGYPNYEVVTNASENDRPAYIFWCKGQGGRQQYDTLMIAAQKVGDFVLKATDPQDNNIYITKTIHVLDKADLEYAYNSQVQNMNMPYTWDFTEGLNFTGLNPNYWTVNKEGTKATLHYGTAMNPDYNDVDQDGDVTESIYKHFVGANNGAMINLAGLQLNLGQQATWPNKKDRIDLSPGDGLSITGDTHKLYIPAPKPHAYTYMGNNHVSKTKVRFYIKGSAMDNKKGGKVDIYAFDGSGNRATLTRVDIVGETGQAEDNNFNRNSDYLCYAEIPFDGNEIEHIELWLGNCHIEWMGYSTESKNISSIRYATYSYPEDLDFMKTVETQQGVTTYAVSKVGSKSVTLTPLGKAKAGQGFVISGNEGEYYYIANARNTYPYSLANDAQDESGEAVTNSLVGTYGDGEAETIAVTGGSDEEFTAQSTGTFHYILSNSGKLWNGDQTIEGVGFYMASSKAKTPFQSAYLPIDAETIRGSIGYFPLFETGETDTIKELETTKSTSGEYYNLNGTRVSRLTKGIYIHNGKKVVIK